MPLHYYLKKTFIKPTVNEIEYYLSMWLSMTLEKRSKNKYSIISHIITNLDQYCAKFHYDVDLEKYITHISLNDVETKINNLFKCYYNKWILNLNNDPDNEYSSASRKKITIVRHNMIDAMLRFMLSYVCNCDDNIFDDVIQYEHYFTLLLKTKISKSLATTNDFAQKKYTEKKISEITNHQKNFDRYKKINHCDKLQNCECPVCYDVLENFAGVFVCGHKYCIECTIDILANHVSCPMCKEKITIDKTKFIIINNKNYVSSLYEYLNKQPTSSAIFTDYKISYHLRYAYQKMDVFDIKNFNMKIIEKNTLEKAITNIIFICSDSVTQLVECLINYFSNMDYQPKIQILRIKIDMN